MENKKVFFKDEFLNKKMDISGVHKLFIKTIAQTEINILKEVLDEPFSFKNSTNGFSKTFPYNSNIILNNNHMPEINILSNNREIELPHLFGDYNLEIFKNNDSKSFNSTYFDNLTVFLKTEVGKLRIESDKTFLKESFINKKSTDVIDPYLTIKYDIPQKEVDNFLTSLNEEISSETQLDLNTSWSFSHLGEEFQEMTKEDFEEELDVGFKIFPRVFSFISDFSELNQKNEYFKIPHMLTITYVNGKFILNSSLQHLTSDNDYIEEVFKPIYYIMKNKLNFIRNKQRMSKIFS